jgi:preprotein translocase SecF subunit
VHDCIIALGLFVLLNGKVSLTVVAAVMTILGYSLNDTIVIFDRIRETQSRKKAGSFHDRVNKSLNECMSRTLITTLTTLFAVAALCILGGGSIFDFALVMLFGVLVGTYSSVCIAPALVNAWHRKS